MENVKKMVYTFDIPEAKHLSAEVKDLIKKILVPNKQRITIEEILKHPWMTKQLSHEPLKIDFKKLREFSSFSKLKALAVSYIATQLPEKDIHQLGILFEQIDTNSDGYLSIE
jgi:serine/threonine protein kinase